MSIDSLLRAQQLHQAGLLDDAMREYETVVSRMPSNAAAWFGLGVLANEVGESQSALDFMQEAVTYDPANPAYLASLGELQRRAGLIDVAVVTLQHANQMFGGNADVLVNLGCALGERADYDGARNVLLQALEMDEARADTYFNLGVVYQRDGNMREAIANLRIAVALAPQYVSAWSALGESLRRTGDVLAAEGAFDRALGLDSSSVVPLIGKAGLALDREDFELAQELIENAKQLSPDALEVQLAEARLLEGRGDLEAAIARYDDICIAFPRELAAYRCKAAIHREQKEFEKALDCLFSALVFAGDNCELLLELAGLCYRDLGYSVAGTYFYKTVLKLRPDHVPTLNAAGRALTDIGLHDEALECLNHALEIAPENGESWECLGSAQYAKGMHEDAIESYKRALEQGWEPAYVNNCMGNVCNRIGDLEVAAEYYKKSLEINPGNYSAAANLGSVMFDIGDVKQSNRYFALADGIPLESKYRAQFELNRGFCRLASGNLELGWAGYDFRQYGAKHRFSHTPWQGEPLDGKSILIWQDQGMGDVIMFGTMYGEVIERAGFCVIECVPKLLPLLRRTFPRAAIVPTVSSGGKVHPLLKRSYDFQVSQGSLGRWLRPRLSAFPKKKTGYLQLDRDRVRYWSDYWRQDNKPQLKVGICWRSKVVDGGRSRFYSDLGDWSAIFSIPGVRFVNLQYDDCSEELKIVRDRFGADVEVLECVDMFNDIDETASMISTLDLVISAPTSVAMISAAAGVPTWLMTVDGCMSWPLFGTRSHKWFPAIKPFLRHWDEPWSAVLEMVAMQLRDHAETRNALPEHVET